MRGERAGCQPPCDGAALQQHQRAVPEQLGTTSDTPAGTWISRGESTQRVRGANAPGMSSRRGRKVEKTGVTTVTGGEKSGRGVRQSGVMEKESVNPGMTRLGEAGQERQGREGVFFVLLAGCILNTAFQCKAYTVPCVTMNEKAIYFRCG